MTKILLCVIVLLLSIILILLIKISLLRKSAGEICDSFTQKLTEDTNTLIDISSRDFAMRKLAAQINEELRRLYEARRLYQQGDQELKEAVTNISHDLRTPLAALCGYLDLLDREEKSETVQHYLAQIRNRADALEKLTEELFRYSIVSSSHELNPERVNVVQILEENLLLFYELMQEKNIRPVISLPENPVWRRLDVSALNRIFSNIISNAIKYSDGDLAVTMDENGTVIFTNTAVGLTPVMAGRLFDRFYTVEASRNSTGLTERMGGRIESSFSEGKLSITLQFEK